MEPRKKDWITDARQLLLIDGIGACITALLLFFIIGHNFEFFGVSRQVLYPLIFIAIFLVIFSLGGYLFLQSGHKIHLRRVAFLNIFYCCVTVIFVLVKYREITIFGKLYFLIEIMIIMGLVLLELRVSKK